MTVAWIPGAAGAADELRQHAAKVKKGASRDGWRSCPRVPAGTTRPWGPCWPERPSPCELHLKGAGSERRSTRLPGVAPNRAGTAVPCGVSKVCWPRAPRHPAPAAHFRRLRSSLPAHGHSAACPSSRDPGWVRGASPTPQGQLHGWGGCRDCPAPGCKRGRPSLPAPCPSARRAAAGPAGSGAASGHLCVPEPVTCPIKSSGSGAAPSLPKAATEPRAPQSRNQRLGLPQAPRSPLSTGKPWLPLVTVWGARAAPRERQPMPGPARCLRCVPRGSGRAAGTYGTSAGGSRGSLQGPALKQVLASAGSARPTRLRGQDRAPRPDVSARPVET